MNPIRLLHWWRKQYSRSYRFLPAGFFVGGVLFDIATLGRIDNLFTIIQQAIYLAIIVWLLNLELTQPHFFELWSQRLPKLWRHRELITHFFFGSLLSVYTIFYFKSASQWSALIFLSLLTGVLVVNEFERFQKLGAYTKFILWNLCLLSYFIYLVPMLLGFIGWLPFLLALTATLTANALAYKIKRWRDPRPLAAEAFKRHLAIPAVLVCGLFFLLYLLKAIPPVPLSVQFMGIYHDVTRIPQSSHYRLVHEKEWWRFWHNGDQLFRAQTGDRIFVFARIFSPTGFADQVMLRWLWRDPRTGWQTTDLIPITISGGRDLGYRGVAYKANYSPGAWRCQVETKDGRVVGSLRFHLFAAAPAERRFKIDIQ